MTSFWTRCQGDSLEQGDYLPDFWVPDIRADFEPTLVEPEIGVGSANLSIMSQSCDLANDKIQLAALCPIADLHTWEQANADCRLRQTRLLGKRTAGAPGRFAHAERHCRRW